MHCLVGVSSKRLLGIDSCAICLTLDQAGIPRTRLLSSVVCSAWHSPPKRLVSDPCWRCSSSQSIDFGLFPHRRIEHCGIDCAGFRSRTNTCDDVPTLSEPGIQSEYIGVASYRHYFSRRGICRCGIYQKQHRTVRCLNCNRSWYEQQR